MNLQTLRFYERGGLLREPDRSLGGHRLYPAETVTILRVMKTAQRLGFTSDEVADHLETGRHDDHRRRLDANLAARAQEKLAEVEERIAELQVIATTLRATVDAGCDGLVECPGSACCPIPFANPCRRVVMTASTGWTRRRLPSTRAALAAVACIARCAVQLLPAAGALSGAGWLITGQWLPKAASGLLGSVGVVWWTAHRRHHRGGCSGGTSCACGPG